MIEINQVYQGDCVDVMSRMEDCSIDLTVTSPPYDNLRSYQGNNKQWSEQVWQAVIKELFRVTKKGGVVVWVTADAVIKGSETGTSFRQALFAKECGFSLHDTMFYSKKNPQPLNHNRYEQSVEYMFIFSRSKPKTVNLLKEPCKNAGKINSGTMRNGGSDGLLVKHGSGKPYGKTKPKRNFWEYSVGNETFNKGGKHPAPFPLQLAKDHIISWSNPGDVVLDPMAGSGTTGVACQNLNRNYILIEKESEYVEICKQRLFDAKEKE